MGHRISRRGIEVDRAKIEIIEKLHPTTLVKGVWSFLGHVGFYRRFIQDLSKVSKSLSNFLMQGVPFEFNEPCMDAFELLKKKLTLAPILVAPDWNLPFDLCAMQATLQLGPFWAREKKKSSMLSIMPVER